jgi:hypothetical protein
LCEVCVAPRRGLRSDFTFYAPAGKPSRDSGTSHEQQYVRQVIELHDKYLAYVSTCFANSSLFHKALKEAFEGFCNKNVAGSTSAELMANFCDNLLKKVRVCSCVLGFAAAACCMGLGLGFGKWTLRAFSTRTWPATAMLTNVFDHCLTTVFPAVTEAEGGRHKLSDEAVGETLEKVVKLLKTVTLTDV